VRVPAPPVYETSWVSIFQQRYRLVPLPPSRSGVRAARKALPNIGSTVSIQMMTRTAHLRRNCDTARHNSSLLEFFPGQSSWNCTSSGGFEEIEDDVMLGTRRRNYTSRARGITAHSGNGNSTRGEGESYFMLEKDRPLQCPPHSPSSIRGFCGTLQR
jgi:hypothetical protein